MNLAALPGPPEHISESEWQVRCDLAALYRLLAYYRMSDFIYTHISARVPGEEDHFLINQLGVLYEEMRASDLVKVDLDGNVIDQDEQRGRRVNLGGFTIHSAIHGARRDLACVIHTHTSAGIAVAAQEHGLLPISQHAMKFYGCLSYHTYEGVALDLDERVRLIADMGPTNKVMILRNHGLLAAGESIADAFLEIYYLERACQAQVAALAGGSKLILPAEIVRQRTASQFAMSEAHRNAHTTLAWRAALRQLDNASSDYRS